MRVISKRAPQEWRHTFRSWQSSKSLERHLGNIGQFAVKTGVTVCNHIPRPDGICVLSDGLGVVFCTQPSSACSWFVFQRLQPCHRVEARISGASWREHDRHDLIPYRGQAIDRFHASDQPMGQYDVQATFRGQLQVLCQFHS